MIQFSNFKLEQKLVSILISIFVVGTILSGMVLSHYLYLNAQQEITSDALMLIETMNAVRDYTGRQVRPELIERAENEFLPEVIPSYSAREVFEKFRMNEEYSDFFYKEAALNPTNPRDLAQGFEVDLIEKFKQSPSISDIEGFDQNGNNKLFYIARPISINNPSCLECHGKPEDAPGSMVAKYGDKAGFGWQLNEIIGTQIILVPASQVLQQAQKFIWLNMAVIIAVFSLVILTANLWLKKSIVRPLTRIAHVAEVVSQGDLDAEFQKLSNDEIGNIASAFSRMKISFALAIKKLEKEKRKNRLEQ